MTGIDKILSQIENEAKGKRQQILDEANLQIEEITRNAKKEAKKLEEEINTKTDEEIKQAKERIDSKINLLERKMILEKKQAILNDVLNEAVNSLNDLSDVEYFELLIKMVEKNSKNMDGEVMLSKKDLSREKGSFEEELKKYKLTLSDKEANINGGLLIVYGEIIENCSFDVILESKKDNLLDELKNILF